VELYSKLNVLKVRLEMAFKRRCGETITRSDSEIGDGIQTSVWRDNNAF